MGNSLGPVSGRRSQRTLQPVWEPLPPLPVGPPHPKAGSVFRARPQGLAAAILKNTGRSPAGDERPSALSSREDHGSKKPHWPLFPTPDPENLREPLRLGHKAGKLHSPLDSKGRPSLGSTAQFLLVHPMSIKIPLLRKAFPASPDGVGSVLPAFPPSFLPQTTVPPACAAPAGRTDDLKFVCVLLSGRLQTPAPEGTALMTSSAQNSPDTEKMLRKHSLLSKAIQRLTGEVLRWGQLQFSGQRHPRGPSLLAPLRTTVSCRAGRPPSIQGAHPVTSGQPWSKNIEWKIPEISSEV
nr:uncharacterized protein LOC123480435 isoform X2 [Desmodus rotundus]